MPYWLYGIDTSYEGKPFLRGPYATQGRADEAEAQLDAAFECDIVWLKTTDAAKATRILKERRIGRHGFREGTRRFRHKL